MKTGGQGSGVGASGPRSLDQGLWAGDPEPGVGAQGPGAGGQRPGLGALRPDQELWVGAQGSGVGSQGAGAGGSGRESGAAGPGLRTSAYEQFANSLRYPEDSAQQELYVQTFEFNPACTLEIGWHLFGENYERGEFLVRMREQLRRHGIAESTELPDHLTYLLALVPRMDHDEAAELVGQSVLPALGKIREALKENPYAALIAAIEDRLEADFPDAPRRPAQLPIFQEAFIE